MGIWCLRCILRSLSAFGSVQPIYGVKVSKMSFCSLLKLLFGNFPIKSDEAIKLLKRSRRRFEYVVTCWIDLLEAEWRWLPGIQFVFLRWKIWKRYQQRTNGERERENGCSPFTKSYNIPWIRIYKRYTLTHKIDSSTMPWDGFIHIVGKNWFWEESLLLRDNIQYWHDGRSKWLQTVWELMGEPLAWMVYTPRQPNRNTLRLMMFPSSN